MMSHMSMHFDDCQFNYSKPDKVIIFAPFAYYVKRKQRYFGFYEFAKLVVQSEVYTGAGLFPGLDVM